MNFVTTPARSTARIALLATSCLLATALTTAQTATTAKKSPLEATCPGASDELVDALSSLARERSEAADVQVNLNVVGNRVVAIETSGAGRVHLRAVERAVRGLGCSGANGTPQSLAFRIQFPQDEPRSPNSQNTAVARAR